MPVTAKRPLHRTCLSALLETDEFSAGHSLQIQTLLDTSAAQGVLLLWASVSTAWGVLGVAVLGV